MRLLVLYLRARRTGFAIAGLIATAVLGSLVADWLITVPQLGGSHGHALIPVVLLVPLISACMIGLVLDSPSNELEKSVSYSLPALRATQLLILGTIAASSMALIARGWDHPESGWMLLRNLAGFAGLTLLTAWIIGGRLSWTVPLAFAMLSLLTSRDAAGTIARWAWTVLPAEDAIAFTTGVILLILGATLLIRYGPRQIARE